MLSGRYDRLRLANSPRRAFFDRLLEAMRRYTNNALTAAEVINELVTPDG
jgi:hypothetical protein